MLKQISHTTKGLINHVLDYFNLAICSMDYLKNLHSESDHLAKIYDLQRRKIFASKKNPIECIVFSKDRALQLHALLSSYLEKFSPIAPVHILYHTSTAEHGAAYDELIKLFPDKPFYFSKQKSGDSFRDDLISTLQRTDCNKLCFLVDDMILTERIGIDRLMQFNSNEFVVSLRMGTNLKTAYTLGKKQPLPSFLSHSAVPADLLCWRWEDGAYDWGYPASVDGHIFSSDEITDMIKLVSFNAPNSLEESLRVFTKIFFQRYGISFQKSCVLNIPCNKVQLENTNTYGDIHQDSLLKQWQNGYQMNYKKLYGFKNESAHQEIPIELIPRS